MKKIVLIVGIFAASITSANTITSVKKIVKKSQSKKEIISKSKRMQCAVVQASCTSAYTCQDWTPQQWYNWGQQIQDNYCQLGGNYAH